MKVGYHPDVQKDVRRVLKRYDEVSDRLGDEFWDELMSLIEAAPRTHFDSILRFTICAAPT